MRKLNWKVLMMLAGLAWPYMVQGETPVAEVSAGSEQSQAPIAQEKLDSLLAPIALYPDQLLMQTLIASTYPLDVVEAARFVKQNKDLKGDALDQAVLKKNWDPSVQSLTGFPQVLEMMNEKLEWTQDLGDAFLTDEKRVMQTVQTLRQKAKEAGNLKSTEQMKVVEQGSTIIIEPAKTEVVYVPSYNPTVVYGTWWAPAYPPYYYPPPPYYYPPGSMLAAGIIGFGIGMAISDNHWGWSHADWHGGDVDININQNNTFINNRTEFKNKASNGKWQHNPSQRKGVAYGNPATREKFRGSDPGAISSRRDARGYDRGAGVGTSDMQRGERGNNFGGDRGGLGGDRGGNFGGDRGGIGTGDMQRGDRGGSLGGDRGGSFGSDRGGAGGRDFGNRGSSFDAGQSRQQARDFSSRGASSRSSMGGGSRSGGGGFGGRSGGGGRRR